MKALRIISLGEVLWDLFPDAARFGGAPANFAGHAALLGADVAIISAVGDDDYGQNAISILRGFGVDINLMQVIPNSRTGTVSVVLHDSGKASYTIHEGSAWDRIEWDHNVQRRLTDADAVYFGTLGQRSELSRNTIRRYLRAAQEAGVPRIVDINLRPPFYDKAMICDSIRLANILKLSDEELVAVCHALEIPVDEPPGTLLRRLIDKQNLDLVVMTRGADGALLVTPGEFVEQPGIPTLVRDTVGAGDSFTAAFLLGVLRGESHQSNLMNACSVAAAVCAHSGAIQR
jgi:fructokinase